MTIKNLKKYLIAVLITGVAFTSCDDPERAEAEREFEEFKSYISTKADRFDNEDELEWDDYESEWNEYDRGYLEHVTTVEDKRDYLSDEDRKEYDRIQSDYDRMRTNYENRAIEEEANASRESELSTQMYASVGITDTNNMALEDVNKTNYRERYSKFVTYVDQNKNNFNQEDWGNADKINEAFRNKRNALGKTIAVQDNTEVKKMETKYNEIRSTTVEANATNKTTTTNNTGANKTNTTK